MMNRRTIKELSTPRALVATGLLAFLLGGCSAQEKMSYRSDTFHPQTITLTDLRTGERLLTVDVPVGQQLNMLFEYGRDRAEREGHDMLRYSLRQWGDTSVSPGSQMMVPPPSARRIEGTLRSAPERR